MDGEAEEHAGKEIPFPALWVHWGDCEAIDSLGMAKSADIKMPEAIANPAKNITVGIIIFLDKNLFAIY